MNIGHYGTSEVKHSLDDNMFVNHFREERNKDHLYHKIIIFFFHKIIFASFAILLVLRMIL